MPYPVKCFFEIYEDMLKVLLTQDSEDEDVFCGAFSALNPACSSAIISSAWGLSLLKMTFSMTLLG